MLYLYPVSRGTEPVGGQAQRAVTSVAVSRPTRIQILRGVTATANSVLVTLVPEDVQEFYAQQDIDERIIAERALVFKSEEVCKKIFSIANRLILIVHT